MIATFKAQMQKSSRLRPMTTSAAKGSSSRGLQSWENKLLRRSQIKLIKCCSRLVSRLEGKPFADHLVSPSASATHLLTRKSNPTQMEEATAQARHRGAPCVSDAQHRPRSVPWRRSSRPTIRALSNPLARMAISMIKKRCWTGQTSTLRSGKSEHISLSWRRPSIVRRKGLAGRASAGVEKTVEAGASKAGATLR